MNWTLELAEPADLAQLLPLIRAYHEFEGVTLDEAARRAGAERLLSDPALGAVWFVMAGAERAGYIALCLGYSLEFGGFDAFIDEFYLRAEFRGHGGGKAALAAVKNAARERGIKMLHLEVARDNLPARKLYAGIGMRAREKYVLMSVAP